MLIRDAVCGELTAASSKKHFSREHAAELTRKFEKLVWLKEHDVPSALEGLELKAEGTSTTACTAVDRKFTTQFVTLQLASHAALLGLMCL